MASGISATIGQQSESSDSDIEGEGIFGLVVSHLQVYVNWEDDLLT